MASNSNSILHNTAIAREAATALSDAVASLTSSSIATKDNQTTVAGNTNAHSVIDLAKSTESQVAKVIMTMSENIHKMASEFQALDENMRSAIEKSNLPNASTGFTLNE
ncbi:TIGR04197 family type VII secretion effector [Streptococcus sp. CSL10205-OR2]|uniref:TIGR04197 family type VII secretion effector n=1 Tax=Streptococcus sp. CSL10205-OR2 TaxID=2980558 RepID=UPI0021D9E621|nr:TIGR04197 family type VII secretion effector [Streptococcus sp. CSL10205-OR2]MCU9533514.1 TIGR04197 family type VII secretion effector [Streptococcus sp. CSL10205-OR2]